MITKAFTSLMQLDIKHCIISINATRVTLAPDLLGESNLKYFLFPGRRLVTTENERFQAGQWQGVIWTGGIDVVSGDITG
jgi:hypothetical protein